MQIRKNISNVKRTFFWSMLFMFFTFATTAAEKFNMGNDAPAPDGFKTEYTYYIFGGVFLVAIGCYYLLKYFQPQNTRKKVGQFDPRRSGQQLRSAPKRPNNYSKYARRRVVPQKKKAISANR